MLFVYIKCNKFQANSTLRKKRIIISVHFVVAATPKIAKYGSYSVPSTFRNSNKQVWHLTQFEIVVSGTVQLFPLQPCCRIQKARWFGLCINRCWCHIIIVITALYRSSWNYGKVILLEYYLRYKKIFDGYIEKILHSSVVVIGITIYDNRTDYLQVFC